jgi:hypothetical protein
MIQNLEMQVKIVNVKMVIIIMILIVLKDNVLVKKKKNLNFLENF